MKGSVNAISPLRCCLVLSVITLLGSCSYNQAVIAESQQETQESHANGIETMEDKSMDNGLDVVDKAVNEMDRLEPASDISYSDDLVSARVMSSGCTRAEDFHIEHTVQDTVCQITLVRDKQDMCRKAPHSIGIQIAWQRPADCSEAALEFMNPALKERNETLRAVLPKETEQ